MTRHRLLFQILLHALFLNHTGSSLVAAAADVPTNDKSSNNDEKDTSSSSSSSYGLDVSLPIHGRVSTNYPSLAHNVDPKNNPTPLRYQNMPIQTLGDKQEFYLQHLDGCREAYSPTNSYRCDSFEYDRMLMNRRQPQSMLNLTEVGFLKIRAPPHLKQYIDEFWEANKGKDKKESWNPGNAYVNHWDSPTTLVSVDDKGLRGSGVDLKRHIWAAASATLEEWTKQELQPCSLYGIRVYHEGAIMMPHVDRLPLVASAMIAVAQDVDEDWPFELYDHQGRAHNISLHPGDMLLFESASVIHGHPFPLKGRYHANIFIHFEPTGKSFGQNETGHYFLRHDEVEESAEMNGSSNSKKDMKKGIANAEKQYRQNLQNGLGGQSAESDGLPPYVKRESPEEEHWRKQHPEGWKPPAQILPPDAHIAAKTGNLIKLEKDLKGEHREDVLTERDENGWQVLHQGVVSGNKKVVELLVANGAEINARTHGGYGETPLRIAEKLWGESNPMVSYLKELGALSIGPEL